MIGPDIIFPSTLCFSSCFMFVYNFQIVRGCLLIIVNIMARINTPVIGYYFADDLHPAD